jgi:hypothetical protein
MNILLTKTDSLGNEIWSREWGGSEDDGPGAVRTTPDGGYVIAGKTHSFGVGSSDVCVIKVNGEGDIVWAKTYGGTGSDFAHCVQVTTDSGFVVTGTLTSFGPGGEDVCLIKLDSNGHILWTRVHGGANIDIGRFVSQTSDGGYILVGTTQSFGAGNHDIYIIKTDAGGNVVWSRTCGGVDLEDVQYAQELAEGGYIVAGETRSFGAGGTDMFVITTDENGDVVWARTYGGTEEDDAASAQQTTDGGFIIAGKTHYSVGVNREAYLIRTDSDGNISWGRVLSINNQTGYAHCVQQTDDRGYIVVGETNPSVSTANLTIMKLDSLGNCCMGEFFSCTTMIVSPTVTSPATESYSPSVTVNIPTGETTSPPTQGNLLCMLLCGDVNGDGIVNVADVIFLVNYLYRGGDPPDPSEVGDVNCDGVVDIGDVVYLVSYLYKGGPPPCEA